MKGTVHEPTIATDELRPTHLEVDLDRVVANYRAIAVHVAPARVMPILKANAYGHGLVEVARALEKAWAASPDATPPTPPILGVAYLEEGLRLRQHGVKLPVLVLGGIVGSQIPRFLEHDLTLTASSVDKLRAIEEHAAAMRRTARVHLKIDTGMERIGVHWYSAEPLLEASLGCRHLRIEGIFTHLANAEAPDLAHARVQLQRFAEVLDFYEKRSLPTPLRHAANSAAILQLPESRLDMVRPGILLYGVRPDASLPPVVPVQPALRWLTRVVFFKVVKAGNSVSYGSAWTASEQARVVTLPVGYGDGYARAMSGKAEVIVHGRRYPVVGRICMDQVMVSIGWDSAYNGDQAVLLGGSDDGQTNISVEEMAAWAGTIPHEVLTNINTRVPRLYRGG
jgi:alanine racemase